MEKFKERQFTLRYNKIMFITFLVVISISTALAVIQINDQTKHDNIQRIEYIRNRSIAIDNLIVSIIEHLNLMQNKAETFFLHKNRIDSSELFQALFNIDDNLYSLDRIPSPYLEIHVGNLTGQGKISAISTRLKKEIEMAFSLNSLFQAT